MNRILKRLLLLDLFAWQCSLRRDGYHDPRVHFHYAAFTWDYGDRPSVFAVSLASSRGDQRRRTRNDYRRSGFRR